MAVDTQDWQKTARELREAGMSEREIARQVEKSPSTVHGVVKDIDAGVGSAEEVVTSNGHAPDALERLVGGGPAEPTPGQQSIDGSEVPVPVEEIRVDGTTQLGLIDFGGKVPASATIRLLGGEYELLEGRAYRKGDRIRFSGTAVVDFVGGKDKTDRKTGIVTTAVQKHTAYIDDLTVNPE